MEPLPDGILGRPVTSARQSFVFERHAPLNMLADELLSRSPSTPLPDSHQAPTLLAELRRMNRYQWSTAANQVKILRGYMSEFREGTARHQFLYSTDLKKWIYLHNKIIKSQKLIAPTLCFQCVQCECLDEQLYALYKLTYLLDEDSNTPYTMTGVYNLLLRTRNLLFFHIREECRDLLVPSFCPACQASEEETISFKSK